MTRVEKIAWQWLICQPPIKDNAARIKPLDFALVTMLNRTWTSLNGQLLEVIRRRAIMYRKAGCPLDAAIKSSVRDWLEAVQ